MGSVQKRDLKTVSDAIAVLDYLVDELKQAHHDKLNVTKTYKEEVSKLKEILSDIVETIEEKREALRAFEKSIFIPQPSYDALLDRLQGVENVLNAKNKNTTTSPLDFMNTIKPLFEEQEIKMGELLEEIKKSKKYRGVNVIDKAPSLSKSTHPENIMIFLYVLSGVGVGSIILNAFIFLF